MTSNPQEGRETVRRMIASLFLCSLLVLCSCQSTVDVQDSGMESGDTEETLPDNTEENYAMDDGTSITPETIVDTDDVAVRVLGIDHTLTDPRLELSFEKGNREYIDFTVDYVKIDDWQVSGTAFPPADSYTLSIQSWSRSYREFTGIINISTVPLSECGLLDQIHQIEFGYQLTGPSSEGILAEGVYTSATSNDGDAVEFTCNGPVLMEADGIKVQLYSFGHGTFLGEDCENLILYVENESDRRIEIVVSDAEKYEDTDPDDPGEEEEKAESNVISRSEKDGKLMTPVPLYAEGNVCAMSRTLAELQTASEEGAVSLSEDEALSFTMSIYDYEEYNSDVSSDPMLDPLYERTVTLTVADMFAPD